MLRPLAGVPSLLLVFALAVASPIAASGNCMVTVVPGDVIQPVKLVGIGDPIGHVGLVRLIFDDGTIITIAGVGGDSPCDFWNSFDPPFASCEENGEPVPLFAAQENDEAAATLNHAWIVVDYDCNGVPDYNIPAATVVVSPL